MAKKKSKREKKEISKESDSEESELENILDKEKLQEIAEEMEEESPEIELDDAQFSRFIAGSTAPGLERVAGEQEIRWVRDMSRVDEDKETQLNYTSNEYKSNDTKYDEPTRTFKQEISTGVDTNISLAGNNSNSRQQNFILNTPESRESPAQRSVENYLQPKTFEQKNEGIPIEQKPEKKYQKFKP